MFLFLSLLQLVVIVSIRNHDYFWRGAKPSPLLAAAVALAGLVSFALPYLPPTARLFTFAPLPVKELAIVVGLIAGIDLRILGFAPALPLAPMRKLLPIMRLEPPLQE